MHYNLIYYFHTSIGIFTSINITRGRFSTYSSGLEIYIDIFRQILNQVKDKAISLDTYVLLLYMGLRIAGPYKH